MKEKHIAINITNSSSSSGSSTAKNITTKASVTNAYYVYVYRICCKRMACQFWRHKNDNKIGTHFNKIYSLVF